MIFRPQLAQRILEGRKTVTRRRAKAVYREGAAVAIPCRYKKGHTYAIQPMIETGPGKGRGGKGIGRIRVTKINAEILSCITDEEARLEGFSSRSAFLNYWQGLYGTIDLTQLIHRIEFELVEAT